MATYRLRVELPDQPGALASVASVIAAGDGNVLSLDIHELDGAQAVDEIVVEAPEEWDTSALERRLAGVGADLLSCAPAVDRDDPMVRALRFAGALVAADPSRDQLELGRAVLEVTGASSAWVSSRGEAVQFEAGRRAMAHDGPVVLRTEDVPASVRADSRGPVWLLAVPDGRLEPTLVAFATRPLGLRFTTSEITRVEALLALHAVLEDRAALAR
ncbi:MAG TPA: hypothetical protein VGO92_01860 [Acidimicrobiales bacterium]|jgi:hypothetical protein|nr:hypothetical protein [Acidimicrobiales bacterium]